MGLRQRLALWLAPELRPERRDRAWLVGRWHDAEIASSINGLNATLKSIEANSRARKTRIIECRHPELHPEMAEALASYQPTDC